MSPATAARIAANTANTALIDKLGIRGSPATVYEDAAGRIRLLQGMLPDDQLQAIFAH